VKTTNQCIQDDDRSDEHGQQTPLKTDNCRPNIDANGWRRSTIHATDDWPDVRCRRLTT